MEYLYKALKREIGVVETAPVTSLTPADQRNEPCAPVREIETRPHLQPGVFGQPVPFPVKTERLYAMRTEKMVKEEVHALEQYRVLRSRVLEILRSKNMRTLMVTSAVSGECKTTTSINLALALSQVQGIKVLLVDTDLRKSGVAEVLGVPYTTGLQDYLHSPGRLSDLVLQLTSSLSFVPSGGVDQNSAELLHSAAMFTFVNEVRNLYDIVIFDSPPLFPIADARVIANLMDAALFCVRVGSTSETVVMEAVTLIRAKIIGTVLAGAEAGTRSGYYYYSGSYGKG